jgi:hypothetical protein
MTLSARTVARIAQLEGAKRLALKCGVQIAARYLRAGNWSIEAALITLAGPQSLNRTTTKGAR